MGWGEKQLVRRREWMANKQRRRDGSKDDEYTTDMPLEGNPGSLPALERVLCHSASATLWALVGQRAARPPISTWGVEDLQGYPRALGP